MSGIKVSKYLSNSSLLLRWRETVQHNKNNDEYFAWQLGVRHIRITHRVWFGFWFGMILFGFLGFLSCIFWSFGTSLPLEYFSFIFYNTFRKCTIVNWMFLIYFTNFSNALQLNILRLNKEHFVINSIDWYWAEWITRIEWNSFSWFPWTVHLDRIYEWLISILLVFLFVRNWWLSLSCVFVIPYIGRSQSEWQQVTFLQLKRKQ